jgi:hypothetical protein
MDHAIEQLLELARDGTRLSDTQLLALAEHAPQGALLACAEQMTLQGHGPRVGYSRKVFIPLTRLCRDACGYCTFASAPRALPSAYLSADEVLAIARRGVAAGCREALFTLGESPSCAGARHAKPTPRPRQHHRLPGRDGRTRAPRNRAAAAPEPWKHVGQRTGPTAAARGVDGHHARIVVGSADRARRPALEVP